jgi:hypothetical protein
MLSERGDGNGYQLPIIDPLNEAVMIEDRVRNWNEDKPWSDMDLFDLQNNIARGDLVEETADFLMRREDEVRGKIRELQATARKKPAKTLSANLLGTI